MKDDNVTSLQKPIETKYNNKNDVSVSLRVTVCSPDRVN